MLPRRTKRLLIALALSLLARGPLARAQDSLSAAPRAKAALTMPGYRWCFQRTPSADIYVLAGSAAESRTPWIRNTVERDIKTDLDWIHQPTLGIRLRLFFVATRAQMKVFTGTPYGGIPFIDEGSVFFATDDSLPPAIRHEIMHVITWRAWGPPSAEWLSEGVATLLAGGCGGYSIDEIVATLSREKRLVPLETLWHHFDIHGENGVIYYMQAASLFDFIDREFGRAKLRAFWPIGAYANIRQRLGIDLPTLEQRWLADVARKTPSDSWAAIWSATQARGCEGAERRAR
ncbi:MAG TPA: hypothetical protein VGM82_09330 [Gemmatimonadaceae bacterium]|jgi:hypothetical protein